MTTLRVITALVLLGGLLTPPPAPGAPAQATRPAPKAGGTAKTAPKTKAPARAAAGPATRPAKPQAARVFPVMEEYVAAGNLAAFLRDASGFLDQHYDSPFAPRVAMDVLMVGIINNDTVTVQRAQAMLVMDYANTPQGTFALTTFGDAREYRQFLSVVLDDTLDDINSTLTTKFARAVRGGVRRFGPELLAEPAFALKCVLLCRDAGDQELADAALAAFNAAVGKNPKDAALKAMKKVGDVCLGGDRSRAEKVLVLHAMKEPPEARDFERLMLGKMSKQELASPRLAGVLAEGRLAAGRFAEALALLEQVPADKGGAALLYRKAWCHAALGRTDQALGLLSRIAKGHAKDPVAGSADRLARSLRQLDQNLAGYADAVLAVADGVREAGPGVVEATVIYRREDGVVLTSYVALVSGELFEMSVRQAERMVLAYSTNASSCRVYRDGGGGGSAVVIDEYAEPGLAPVMRLAMERKADGSYAFDAGLGVKAFDEDLTRELVGLLDSKHLSGRAEVLELLRAKLRRGWFPAPVQEVAGGARTYTWLSPRPGDPALNDLWYTVSPDGRLLRVVSDRLRVQALRYGRKGSFRPSPPAWPEAKVRAHAKLDAAAVVDLFPVAVELFAPPGK